MPVIKVKSGAWCVVVNILELFISVVRDKLLFCMVEYDSDVVDTRLVIIVFPLPIKKARVEAFAD
jgi:hypothetical protein